jgi:hypothetical protein
MPILIKKHPEGMVVGATDRKVIAVRLGIAARLREHLHAPVRFRTPGPIRIKKKSPIVICIKPKAKVSITKKLTIEDLTKYGFSKTGSAIEDMSNEVVCALLRKWITAPTPMKLYSGEKAHWENLIARAGWFRPPPTWEEIKEQYKPVVVEAPKKKVGKILIRRQK